MLGRMYDAIEYRGFNQDAVEELAKYAGVPVFNGLTDEFHPTQMLADVLTMSEHSDKPLHEITYAFVGDTRNNMGHSLMIVGARWAWTCASAAPKTLWPAEDYVKIARELGSADPARGSRSPTTRQRRVKGVDFIHTDVWVSMGEPKEVWAERIELLKPYQVNVELMKASGNPQSSSCTACPPSTTARPRSASEIAEQFGTHGRPGGHGGGVRVARCNVAFEQAENRMHTIKAILVATLARIDAMLRSCVALGGNALLRRGQPMTAEDQRANVRIAAEALARSPPSTSWSSRTATARRWACWPCRAPPTSQVSPIRSMCSARRPRA